MKVYNIIKIIKFPFIMGIDPVLCRKQILSKWPAGTYRNTIDAEVLDAMAVTNDQISKHTKENFIFTLENFKEIFQIGNEFCILFF